MAGMLGMGCLDQDEGVAEIWVLHDYEREIWSLVCLIELPKVKY
jgi:hypothetical protein